MNGNTKFEDMPREGLLKQELITYEVREGILYKIITERRFGEPTSEDYIDSWSSEPILIIKKWFCFDNSTSRSIITIMAVRKFIKKSDGTKMWESMSSSVKKRPTQEWCAFYTPAGRMVSKPAHRRKRGTHPEDFCAEKTPFRGKVIRSY